MGLVFKGGGGESEWSDYHAFKTNENNYLQSIILVSLWRALGSTLRSAAALHAVKRHRYAHPVTILK